MAFTYTTLTSTLEGYLQQYDTDFTTMLPIIIRQAEDRILKATNLPVFKVNKTSACTINARFLAAPSDMLSAFALTIVSNGVYTPLIFRESSLIYEMWGTTSTGQPRYYSLYNDTTFLLGPTPDAAYPVEFQYFYRPESITTAVSGTTWLATNAENCLLYACIYEAYVYMKGDQQVMAPYEKSFQDALVELQRLGEGLNERDSYTDNDPKVAVQK